MDPIRVVPLRTEALAPAAAPRLTYRGGPLLASAQVFLFFWGDAWQRDPQAAMMQRLSDFFDYLVASPLLDQLTEYSVQDFQIGHGARTGAIAVTTPTPAGATLYSVFLPPGVTAELGGASSCVNFCGYHNEDQGLYYAVMPYPDCAGCEGGLPVFDALTSTASHELCEARGGTTTTTARSRTSARGRRSNWVDTPCSWSGRTFGRCVSNAWRAQGA